jgi:predicted RNA-binding protein with PUA-like domain
MSTFLVKTEPTEYAFADLQREKRSVWTGVANASALTHLRAIKQGDEVLIYHTGSEKAIAGLAKAVSNPYEDPDQPGLNDRGEPKFAVIDLAPVKPAKTPVTLAQIKDDARFKDFALVRIGRLSVMPVPAPLDTIIRKWAGL